MTIYGHFSILSIHFRGPSLNRVIIKQCYKWVCEFDFKKWSCVTQKGC